MFDLNKFGSDLKKYLVFLQIEKGLADNTIISYKQELEKLKKYLKKKRYQPFRTFRTSGNRFY